MRMHEWVSPMTIALRDLTVPDIQGGRQMGADVLAALGFHAGFTHMEWYRKADGEVVFGEIGARPPGARVGRRDELRHRRRPVTSAGRRRSCTAGCTRSSGTTTSAASSSGPIGGGRITHIEGLDRLLAEFGDAVTMVDLLPVGAPRRDWRSTVIGDGMIIVRHPEFQRVVEMTDRFAAEVKLYAN